MRVIFEQHGGFAGLSRGAEIDTEQLPSHEAARLESLLTEAAPSEAAARGGPDPAESACLSSPRDATHYQIRTEGCESPRTICFDDTTITEHQMGLLAYIQRHAKPRPPR